MSWELCPIDVTGHCLSEGISQQREWLICFHSVDVDADKAVKYWSACYVVFLTEVIPAQRDEITKLVSSMRWKLNTENGGSE